MPSFTVAKSGDTATCPLCGEQATFYLSNARYVCKSAVHGHRYYSFAGESGYCNESGCRNKASIVEPEFRARYDSEQDALVYNAPNTRWSGDGPNTPNKGLRYCGTHSPSAKAERKAEKDKERTREYNLRQDSKKARLSLAEEEVATLIEVVREAGLNTYQADALRRLGEWALSYKKENRYGY